MVDNKIYNKQNAHHTDWGKEKPHPTYSQLTIPFFPAWMEVPHEWKKTTFEEVQEKLKENWKNANLEEEISYMDYVEMRIRYSRGGN